MQKKNGFRKKTNGILLCLLLLGTIFPCGCSSVPWAKKKDEIYSPKPSYVKKVKKSTKSRGKEEKIETTGEFLALERVWN